MPSHEKAYELATEFENAYPQTLAERLEWWRHALGIDRPRLLRMIGMSAAEARRQQGASWDDLFKKKEWEESAWWVEGKLHELLALFDYDWKALSDRLHHGADSSREEQTKVNRKKGDIPKLRYNPSNDGTETLLNQLAKGGPDSFSALIKYLGSERSS
jgi:hypothetical protein